MLRQGGATTDASQSQDQGQLGSATSAASGIAFGSTGVDLSTRPFFRQQILYFFMPLIAMVLAGVAWLLMAIAVWAYQSLTGPGDRKAADPVQVQSKKGKRHHRGDDRPAGSKRGAEPTEETSASDDTTRAAGRFSGSGPLAKVQSDGVFSPMKIQLSALDYVIITVIVLIFAVHPTLVTRSALQFSCTTARDVRYVSPTEMYYYNEGNSAPPPGTSDLARYSPAALGLTPGGQGPWPNSTVRSVQGNVTIVDEQQGWMTGDLDIPCDSSTAGFRIGLGIAYLALYVFGIPIVLSALLLDVRRRMLTIGLRRDAAAQQKLWQLMTGTPSSQGFGGNSSKAAANSDEPLESDENEDAGAEQDGAAR